MSTSHCTGRWLVWTLVVLTLGFRAGAAAAQEAEDADATAAEESAATEEADEPEADRFAVPEGTPAELLEFIEGLAHRNEPFATQDELRTFLDRVSTSIGTAADNILAAKATDQQTIDAIEWKIEAMRIRGQLGDRESDAKTDEFLAGLATDSRPAVAEAVEKIQGFRKEMQFVQTWMTKLRSLRRLDAAARAEIVDQLVKEIESGDLFANQLVVLVQYCDLLADTDDSSPAVEAVNKLLPLFRASDDPEIAGRISMLEGIARRLNLPGNEIDLDGTYLDGTPLDWSDYRGKVVLIDFWATGCGPCLMEVPNVVENYRQYHDKGFDVLGISLDVDRDTVERVMREANIPWRTLFHGDSETGSWFHPMASKYGVTGIPRAILIDQQGKVVHMNARGRILGEQLQRLLGEPAVDATSAVADEEENKTALSKPR